MNQVYLMQESTVLECALKNVTVEDLTPSEDIFGFKTVNWYKVNNWEQVTIGVYSFLVLPCMTQYYSKLPPAGRTYDTLIMLHTFSCYQESVRPQF